MDTNITNFTDAELNREIQEMTEAMLKPTRKGRSLNLVLLIVLLVAGILTLATHSSTRAEAPDCINYPGPRCPQPNDPP